jgi:hypothetical protein
MHERTIASCLDRDMRRQGLQSLRGSRRQRGGSSGVPHAQGLDTDDLSLVLPAVQQTHDTLPIGTRKMIETPSSEPPAKIDYGYNPWWDTIATFGWWELLIMWQKGWYFVVTDPGYMQ